MALANNTWSLVAFKPFSNAAWIAYADPPYPTIPSSLMNTIISGSSLNVFCGGITGTTAQIAWFEGGGLFQFDTSVLATDTVQATLVTTMDNGDVWYSMKDTASPWLFFSSAAGLVNVLSVPAALGAFIL